MYNERATSHAIKKYKNALPRWVFQLKIHNIWALKGVGPIISLKPEVFWGLFSRVHLGNNRQHITREKIR